MNNKPTPITNYPPIILALHRDIVDLQCGKSVVLISEIKAYS